MEIKKLQRDLQIQEARRTALGALLLLDVPLEAMIHARQAIERELALAPESATFWELLQEANRVRDGVFALYRKRTT